MEGHQTTTLAARFWAKVARKSDAECWLWTASATHADERGYGQFYPTSEKSVRAHRFAYELTRGPIPAGLDVLHSCDVRRCCNPGHLFLGTDSDNAKDAYRKGRRTAPHRWTARYGVAADVIRLIRSSYQSTPHLAQSLNLAPALVNAIRHGYRWDRSVVMAERSL